MVIRRARSYKRLGTSVENNAVFCSFVVTATISSEKVCVQVQYNSKRKSTTYDDLTVCLHSKLTHLNHCKGHGEENSLTSNIHPRSTATDRKFGGRSRMLTI